MNISVLCFDAIKTEDECSSVNQSPFYYRLSLSRATDLGLKRGRLYIVRLCRWVYWVCKSDGYATVTTVHRSSQTFDNLQLAVQWSLFVELASIFYAIKTLVSMQVIKSEIVLWTAGFVLLTLLVNGSSLPFILRKTGLSKGKFAETFPVR